MGPTSNLTTTTVHLLICRVPGCCQMPLYPTRHMALHRPCMLAGYFLYIATQPAIATRCLPCLNVTLLTLSTPCRSVHPPPLAVADVASTVADVVADAHGCVHTTNMNLLCIGIVLVPGRRHSQSSLQAPYALFHRLSCAFTQSSWTPLCLDISRFARVTNFGFTTGLSDIPNLPYTSV